MDAGAAAAAAAGGARGLPEPPGALPVRPGTRGPGAGGWGRPRLPSPGAEAGAPLLRQIRHRLGLRECDPRGRRWRLSGRRAWGPSRRRKEGRGWRGRPRGWPDVGVVGGHPDLPAAGARGAARGLLDPAGSPPPHGPPTSPRRLATVVRGARGSAELAWSAPPRSRPAGPGEPRHPGIPGPRAEFPLRQLWAALPPGSRSASRYCPVPLGTGPGPVGTRRGRGASAGQRPELGPRRRTGPGTCVGAGVGKDRRSRPLPGQFSRQPAVVCGLRMCLGSESALQLIELVSVQSFGLGKQDDPEIQFPVAEHCHHGGPPLGSGPRWPLALWSLLRIGRAWGRCQLGKVLSCRRLPQPRTMWISYKAVRIPEVGRAGGGGDNTNSGWSLSCL